MLERPWYLDYPPGYPGAGPTRWAAPSTKVTAVLFEHHVIGSDASVWHL